jgi:hypothetical protein
MHTSPISLLPSELLHMIFSPVASLGPFQFRHALFVCKRWHNVITSDKRLWSTIIIDEEIMFRFRIRGMWPEISRAKAYIRACLDRSAPVPLDVTLSAQLEDKHETDGCSMLDDLFNSGEPRHIQRCRSFTWYIAYSSDDMPVVSTLLPSSLEKLEYLFLKDFSIGSASLIRFPQCPRLKEVHLANHFDGDSPKYFLDRDHPHVERLTYTSSAGWMDHDIPYIQYFHGIRTLVLEDATLHSSSAYQPLPYEPLLDVENTSIAHLHCLETLKLVGSIPLDIMQRLHAPILRRVDIATGNFAPQHPRVLTRVDIVRGNLARQLHALDTVPLVLLQSVTEMGIFIYSETPPDPQHLRRVIRGAPLLTSLFGTFRIGELLAGEGWFRERNIVYHCL